MADYFRRSDVKVVLDFGFTKYHAGRRDRSRCTTTASRPSARIRTRSSVTGCTSTRTPACRRACASCAAASTRRPASSASPSPARAAARRAIRCGRPFYDLCIEARIPGAGVRRHDGPGRRPARAAAASCSTTAIRGTSTSSPRSFPDLRIVAARPGWPWQTETIAVLMHKRNIWYDLHGWSPKYFTRRPEARDPAAAARARDVRRRLSAVHVRAARARLARAGLPGGRARGRVPPQRRALPRGDGAAMNLELDGKVAIVGGASQGIGYGIARALASEGCVVAITARREADLQAAADAAAHRDGRRHAADPGRRSPRRRLPARGRDRDARARRRGHPGQQRRRAAARRHPVVRRHRVGEGGGPEPDVRRAHGARGGAA